MILKFEIAITEEQQKLIAKFWDWANNKPVSGRMATKTECRRYIALHISQALKNLEDLKTME